MFTQLKRLSNPVRDWFRRYPQRPAAFLTRDVLPLGLLALEALEARVMPTVNAWGPVRFEYNAATAAPAFSDLAAIPDSILAQTPTITLTDMRAMSVNPAALKALLKDAPPETLGAAQRFITISLPTPDGKSERFRVWETSIAEPGYVTANPDMKMYRGVGIDDPYASLAADHGGVHGFHASVRSPNGSWYVDPYYHLSQSVYAVYDRGDAIDHGGGCGCATCSGLIAAPDDTTPGTSVSLKSNPPKSGTSDLYTNGTQLRTFRLALAATAEYTAKHGNTVAGGEAAIKTALDRVNQVYEAEVAIRMTLVPGNTSLIYAGDVTKDPYNNDSLTDMTNQNQVNIDTVIGNANYDIGHVFSTNTNGGFAPGNVGVDPEKAKAATGNANPTGNVFWVDYVAHEMGHQFGADHTFNVNIAARAGATAYEPGGGSTIMAYAGVSDVGNANQVQNQSDHYFHILSLSQITDWITNNIPNVGGKIATNNTAPVIDALPEYTIPARTPFEMKGSATDANGDAIFYNWEQFDLGPAQNLGAPDNGQSPLFRSVAPSPTGNNRSFPDLATVLAGLSGTKNEVSPTTNRTLNFRLTARDKAVPPAAPVFVQGAYASAATQVHVVDTGETFKILNFNTFEDVYAGSKQTVFWDVAKTFGFANGINTPQVHVELSTDGGQNFTTLLTTTANDGNADVTLPTSAATTKARFRVRGAGNIFYDINDADFNIKAIPTTFTVTSDGSGPGLTLQQALYESEQAPGHQTITFSNYFATPRTITLFGAVNITQPLTIQGPGADKLTITGAGTDRLFRTNQSFTPIDVTFRGLTMTGGRSADGAALYIEDENVTIEDCILTGNTATNDGGAIHVENGGTLTLRRTTVSNNRAASDGGGIHFKAGGSAVIIDSTLSSNHATNGVGGGLFFYGTVNGNGFTIGNTTIAQNTSNAGGGLFIQQFQGTLNLLNSTITSNIVPGGLGGGLFHAAGVNVTGTIDLLNSIVSNNSAANSPDIDSYNTVLADSSAIGSTAGVTISGSNNIIGQNLKLKSLANNGGPTRTVAFDFDSPLRDSGLASFLIANDQRGLPRDNGGGVDIGAFELHTAVLNTSDSGVGSLRDAVAESNRVADADSITFSSYFNTPRQINLTSGEIAIAESVTIIGPGAGNVIVNGNNTSRHFNSESAPVNSTVNIRGLTLALGKGIDGGSINIADENLILEDSVLVNNSATEDGGAINVQSGGTVFLLRSTLTGNIATDDGGGISFNGGGSANIVTSALVNNTASNGDGGGLYFFGTVGAGDLTFNTSTVSGNSAKADGGAIELRSFTGTLNVFNSTIVANSTSGLVGGGISRPTGTGSITLASSIVSGNSSTFAHDINSTGTVTVNRSAIGDLGGFTLTGANNITGQNLKLRALANNGGPTPTIAFEFDSPLRGVGLIGSTSVDQRNLPRNVSGTGFVDIGAFELQTRVINANNAGPGSLRDAVAESNRVVGIDTIDFKNPFSIGLTTGELFITDAVIVQGQGLSSISINGNAKSRIFNTTGVVAGKIVTIRGVTLLAGSAAADGGAILIGDESVTLEDSVIANSTATTFGGAISVGAGGKLSLVRSTLNGNTAATGGAIRFVNGGNSEINASTLSGNKAIGGFLGSGGAIYISGQGSSVGILNSTLSGNSSNAGGGIGLANFSGALTVRNTTITSNSAANSGGGMDAFQGTPNINIESTIVAGNTAPNAADIAATSMLTINRSAIGAASGFTSTGAGNLPFGMNLKLGALANNGGTMLTHVPAETSPLVNAGSNPAGISVDQRGAARTLHGATDIGSVENTFTPPDITAPTITSITSTSPNKSYGLGDVINVTINLSEYVTLTGTLNVTLDTGAVVSIGTGTNAGTSFSGSYTVSASQNSPDLNVTALALSPGSTLRDNAFNDTVLTLPALNLANSADIVVFVPPPDTTAPTIASITSTTPAGSYGTGNTINVSLNFSEAVTLSGFLFVFFDSGGSMLIQGPQTASTLTGVYTVGSGQNSPDLNVTLVQLQSGNSLTDTSGNNAVLTLPASNLANNASLVVGTNIAATFTVTNTANSGSGSLRQAVLDANASPGFDAITFDASFNTAKTIILSTSIDITDGVMITGKGASLTTIQGGGSDRLFLTQGAPAGVVINFADMTLTGGRAGNGAGLFIADESVTVSNCILSNNSTSGVGGAMIVQAGGKLNIIASTLSGNTASFGGGVGVISGGTVDIRDTTLVGNTASNNQGGGLYFSGTVGTGGFKLLNSTVSGNKAATYGAGIALRHFNGKFEAVSSTIANNSSSYLGGGISRTDTGTGSIFLRGSIVSGNSATSGGHDLYSNTAVDAFFSAIGKSGGFALTTSNGFNLDYGTDLKLAALANNGGPTLTHKPAGDSPLLNAGSNYYNVAYDQRGSGFPRLLNNAPDIGAVEVPFVLPTVVLNANDSGTGSLRQAILNANTNPGADTVSFDPAFFSTPRTITLAGTQLTLSDTTGVTTITGPGLNLLTINGNNASRVFLVNSGVTTAISGLTISGGNGVNGGALQNSGTLTVSNARFTANHSDLGGAIYSVGALSVANSTFDNNSANTGNGWGGAIINGTTVGVANITGCTFTNNSASALGGALIGYSYNISDSAFTNNTSNLNGGAVRTDGIVTITGSTFSGNSAANDGGAIMSHGNTSITNSTLAGNTASSGGGVFFFQGTGALRNVTVANNSASNTGGGTQVGTATSVSAVNTIIAGNTAPTGANASGDPFTANSSNNLLNVSAAVAGLRSLASNGGVTQTVALNPTSPALNAGTSAGTPATDQRGMPRVGNTDIGAFELNTIVTNTLDAGPGSLRDAVLESNRVAGADTITFDASFNAATTITLTTGVLSLTDAVTIDGPGTNLLTVSGNNASPIFHTHTAPAAASMTFNALRIANGNGGSGGAIYASNQVLTFNGVAIENNIATGSGGAVFMAAAGAVRLSNSTISGNSTPFAGGGVYFVNGGQFICEASSIINNVASSGGGGGVFLAGALATDSRIVNSTISGNSAAIGGGVCLAALAGTLPILNCTLANNSASNSGGGLVQTGTGTVTITSSIVSGNAATSAADISAAGTVTLNYSAIGSASGFTFAGGSNLAFGTNLKLGALADNGGPTLTMLPANDSPLLGKGSNPAVLTVDQRGQARVAGGIIDIGAVEAPSPITDIIINGGAVQRSRVTSVVVNFASPVDAAMIGAFGAISFTRTSGGPVGNVVDAASGLVVSPAAGMVSSITLTFQNIITSGVNSGSLADGRWQLSIPALNYTSPLNAIHRLFGDVDGNANVTGNDFLEFGNAFNGASLAFDYDNDGVVTGADLLQFGNRFGVTL